MKTADEARMAMSSFKPESLPGFKKIGDAIESAIRNDKSSVYLEESLDSRLIKYMRDVAKYEVTITSDRNQEVTIISW